MKSIRVIAITIFLLIIISAGTLLALAYYLNSSTDELSDEIVVFQVDKGASFNGIASDLEGAQLIRSSMFLKVFNKVTGSNRLIKTGSYNIDKNLTALKIVNQLVEGKQKLVPVVVPEGLTIRKIAVILAEAGIVDEDDFIKAARDGSYLSEFGIDAATLEGFLFPDTYSFQQNFPAEKITRHMVDVFFTKLKSVYPDYKMLTNKQIYEKIVLSSIIEKEYRVPEEASKMASVYYNRLDQGWNLGSCPTIVYIIEEEQLKDHPERLTYADLEISSQFNTYQNQGLPPSPISNPGIVALDAVFNPAQTDYMFFVVKDLNKGSHEFTKNLSDHVRAKQDYLNNFRSK
jgi:peptidoglycan lytic transglycosylase G